MELHRGRLLDHVQLVVRDLPAAERFYTAVAAGLGIPVGGRGEGFVWIDELVLRRWTRRRHRRAHRASSSGLPGAGPGDRGGVYQAALAAGAGQRRTGTAALSSDYYAAFVLDPDGNIEVVYHGPARRSAPSVQISFDLQQGA